MRRGTWTLALVAILGLASFFYLFPGSDPSAHFDLRIDREQAFLRARELANRMRVQLGDSDDYGSARINQKDIYYLSSSSSQPGGLFVSPLTLRLRLEARDSREFLEVSLTGDGRPLRIEKRRPSAPEDGQDQPRPGTAEIQQALELLAGDSWTAFEPSQEPEVRNGRVTLQYRAPSLAAENRVPRITIEAVGSEVYLARGYPGYSEDFERRFSNLDDLLAPLVVFVTLACVVLVILGVSRYILTLFDRLAPYREVLTLIALVVVVDLFLLVFGEGWQTAGIDDDGIVEIIVVHLLKYLFVVTPTVAGIWGAGEILADSRSIPRRIHAHLLLKGWVTARPVGKALALGACMAGVLASIPLLLVAVGAFPNAVLEHHDPRGWLAWIPALVLFEWFPQGPVLPIFGVVCLIYPWLSSRIRRRSILHLLRILLLGVALSVWGFQFSLPANLCAGFLGALLIEWIYRRSGLLAAIACGIFATILHNGMSMIVQPASTISFQGWLVLFLSLATLAFFALTAIRGAEIDLRGAVQQAREDIERRAASRQAEREQLLAEFGVARRAQELMLPERPPQLPGVEISAVCTPAREVGGDLFDFLRFKDGRTGIVVADVSGKGVPAALYMTLAKGLLCSVAESENSPAEVVRQVNEHFHGCAQKRVFATLALTVLDPERGVVECARAGHNPILWQRSTRGEIRTVNPSGIGLGLAPDRLFARSLSVQTCRIAPGDALIVYSDGIPEAMNEEKEEYGMERFQQAIRETRGMDARQCREHLLNQVRTFVGKTAPSDDITLVIIRFLQEWAA